VEVVRSELESKYPTPPAVAPVADAPPEPTVQVITLLLEFKHKAEPLPEESPVKDTVEARVAVDATDKVLVLVDPLVAKEEAANDPEKLAPAPTKAEVILNDAPTPTLPVEVRVESLVSAKELNPVTDSPDKSFIKELNVAVPPIPILPEVLSVDKLVLPVTEREEDREVPDVTVKDAPTPTLPDTFMEEPTPKNPLKNPVPVSRKL